MSTVQEQLVALRAGIVPTSNDAETPQPPEPNEDQDDLINKIVDLGLFDAVVPTPAGERLFEYEERRKMFNLILHDFISEQLNAQYEAHEEEKEELEARISSLNDLYEKESLCSADLQYEYDRLQGEFQELKESYEKAKEERKYEAPSESIKTRVAGLKDLSADDMVKRFEERQAAKMNGGQSATDLQFRTEIDTPQLGDNPILASVEIPRVTFPVLSTGEVQTNSADGTLVAQDIRDYIDKRIQDFAQKNNLIA